MLQKIPQTKVFAKLLKKDYAAEPREALGIEGKPDFS
jgi:hypothetical protein